MRARKLIPWSFLATLLGSACSPATNERANVVLISIDSLRADHLACYGYERETSPVMDRLAAEGARFTNAVSSTSWTLPAHASMFTGLPPSGHGCTAATGLPRARPTLAEALTAHGYETAGFWSGPYLHPAFGLHRGFETYTSCASYDYDRPRRTDHEQSHADITSPRILAEVTRWLDGRSVADKRPFFLFVHMWDVHYDYIPPPPYDTLFDADYTGPVDGSRPGAERPAPRDLEHLIALYDGEIAWTDLHVGKLLEAVGAHVPLDETLVIVTSDHGEEFYEHGEFGHRKALFEESIAVPLIVRHPGRVAAGTTIDTAASVTDLPATILEFVGRDEHEGIGGRSLVPLLTGKERAKKGLAISELARKRVNWLSVRGETWKVLLERDSGRMEGWWDLDADPAEAERRDAASLAPEIGRTVEGQRRWLLRMAEAGKRTAGGEASLPPGLDDTLRDLGYVGGDEE